MIERITKGGVGDGSTYPYRHVRIIADGTDVTDTATAYDTERRTVEGLVCDKRGYFMREQDGTLTWLGYFREVKLVDRARVAEGRRKVYR